VNRHLIATAAVLALALTQAAPAAAQAADPFTGVWRIQNYGAAGSSNQVLTISVKGDEETYQSDLTTSDGTRQLTNYTARYDGKEYPSRTQLTGGPNPPVVRQDKVVLRKVSAHQRERHWMQDGRLSRVLQRVVSADGRVLTSQIVDYDAAGVEKRGGTLVFHKQ
jgi:hypothetical protein